MVKILIWGNYPYGNELKSLLVEHEVQLGGDLTWGDIWISTEGIISDEKPGIILAGFKISPDKQTLTLGGKSFSRLFGKEEAYALPARVYEELLLLLR